jgi:tyrosine-specific transport protein
LNHSKESLKTAALIGLSCVPGTRLLDLYDNSLGKTAGGIGSAAYFFLYYAMMVAYIAQGGVNLVSVLPGAFKSLPHGAEQVAFATVCGMSLFAASSNAVAKASDLLVAAVVGTFGAIMWMASSAADFIALINPVNQHLELVINCCPILFLAFVFQNVVPTVVTQLEGDQSKIINASIGGTTVPLLMFLTWNAVILGNGIGSGDLSNVDPVALLQSGAVAGGSPVLGPLVTAFLSAALLTSVVGFTYSLVDAWTDVFNVKSQKGDEHFEKWKPALFGLIFVPPLALAVTDPSIFYDALFCHSLWYGTNHTERRLKIVPWYLNPWYHLARSLWEACGRQLVHLFWTKGRTSWESFSGLNKTFVILQ